MDKEISFENPFEEEVIAKHWIHKVENESGRARDKEIYPRLQEWIRESDPQTVAEIGCGQGICSDKLGASENFQYIGIDPSKFLIERARELYENKNINFLEGSAYALPLKDFSMDAVFSNNVWFHLKNIAKASEEMARVLKPDGKFLIITRNPGKYDVFLTFFKDPIQIGKRVEGEYILPEGNMPHSVVFLHSYEEMIKNLEKNNLVLDKTEYFGSTLNKDVFLILKGHKKP